MARKHNNRKTNYRLFFSNGRTAKYTCSPNRIVQKIKGDDNILHVQEIIETA